MIKAAANQIVNLICGGLLLWRVFVAAAIMYQPSENSCTTYVLPLRPSFTPMPTCV